MKRSKRMQPIVELADNREREAARQVGAARHELGEREQRLQELIDYRDEYAQRFDQAGAVGLDTATLLSYRQFLSQLHEAIEYQRKVVADGERLVEQRIEEWKQVRTRLEALGKVVERLHREEADAVERQEQKETDEFGQRSGRRR